MVWLGTCLNRRKRFNHPSNGVVEAVKGSASFRWLSRHREALRASGPFPSGTGRNYRSASFQLAQPGGWQQSAFLRPNDFPATGPRPGRFLGFKAVPGRSASRVEALPYFESPNHGPEPPAPRWEDSSANAREALHGFQAAGHPAIFFPQPGPFRGSASPLKTVKKRSASGGKAG